MNHLPRDEVKASGEILDLTADFTGLAYDDRFVEFMTAGYDRYGLIFRQTERLIGDSQYIPGLNDLLSFSGRFDINEALAEITEVDGIYSMVMKLEASGRDYIITVGNNTAEIQTTGYDGSELVHHTDNATIIKFLLGLVHLNIGQDNLDNIALPEGFEKFSNYEKLKLALSMLGEISGLTVEEYVKTVIDDPSDSSFSVKLVDASGIGFDGSTVTVDMDWQLAEGKYTLVSLRSDERLIQDKNTLTACGIRAPIGIEHFEFPFMMSYGMMPPINDQDIFILNPHNNYNEWRRAVIAVMQRLIPIYSVKESE